ncbi:MAG: protease complex subunit PrcB family protein [Balneolaceae bacterium]|nr:protease complex subunit PrcB family protein [Balneolaceae bacterium]
MKYSVVISTCLLFLFIGCDLLPSDPDTTDDLFEDGEAVFFSTIDKGFFSNMSERQKIIKKREAFETFWSNLHAGKYPLPETPEVDFGSQMVIAYSMGSQSSGGYITEITQVQRSESLLGVKVKNRSPGKGCIVTWVITTPYHIIRLKKSDQQVQFIEENITNNCRN